jgi:sulfopropanediol 3-dehydrogenase
MARFLKTGKSQPEQEWFDAQVFETVRAIIEDVSKRGDDAGRSYS